MEKPIKKNLSLEIYAQKIGESPVEPVNPTALAQRETTHSPNRAIPLFH